MDWTDLAQNRDQWRALMNTIMNLWFPHIVEKFLSIRASGSFSRRAQLHGVSYQFIDKWVLFEENDVGRFELLLQYALYWTNINENKIQPKPQVRPHITKFHQSLLSNLR
jgi:hypothetical protein